MWLMRWLREEGVGGDLALELGIHVGRRGLDDSGAIGSLDHSQKLPHCLPTGPGAR